MSNLRGRCKTSFCIMLLAMIQLDLSLRSKAHMESELADFDSAETHTTLESCAKKGNCTCKKSTVGGRPTKHLLQNTLLRFYLKTDFTIFVSFEMKRDPVPLFLSQSRDDPSPSAEVETSPPPSDNQKRDTAFHQISCINPTRVVNQIR